MPAGMRASPHSINELLCGGITMQCGTMNKPVILHASSSSMEERLSQLEQKFNSFYQWVQEEFQKRDEEDQKKDQRIEALEKENHDLKQKVQQLEQFCTSNAELLSKLLFRVYQLEVSQACFYRKYKIVDRNSSIYDAFSPEELDHHEERIKMKEVYDSPPIKADIKGSKSSRLKDTLKKFFYSNRQKNSYKNQELLQMFQADIKTVQKVIHNILSIFPNCFKYSNIDSKNKGIVITNRELFEQSLRHWV